jgi:hypothetical protein
MSSLDRAPWPQRTGLADPRGPEPEPPAPGGHSEPPARVAAGALPAVAGTPPVTTATPALAGTAGESLPGVELAQHPRRRGDTFGWPANAAPGKPEGEVDTRP